MKHKEKQKEFKTRHPKGPKYFEGILQLRNPNQKIVDFVWDEVDKSVEKQVYIQKSVRQKTGLDYYITSNKFLKSLGKKLQERFGGELKLSSKLFSRSRQTGKELHRLTVMFRLPEFNAGDKVEFKGDEYKVRKISKKIFLQNKKTGKKVILGQRDICRIRKIG